ncbi:MAG: hypothetical protein ACLPUT_08390 [Solirubrobacteraceae bacterium]
MSTVPTYLEPRAHTRPWNTSERAGVSRHPLAAVAALSSLLALVFVLAQSLAGGHASTAPGARANHGFSHAGLLSLPLAAQGPVSATLGAYAPVYRMTAAKDGFAAMNPAQRLDSRFDRAGVSVSAGATRVGLSLQAVGYGASLRALAAATPSAKANRVVYARGNVSEWYVNGPLGVEQGFTVARAPAGHAAGPLTLVMAFSGDAHAALAAGGQSITFSHAGGPALRYSGLSATGAGGRVLHSWLALQRGRLLLRVDTRGARYPLRIDPFIHQGEKLNGSGLSGPYGYIGQSVALSANGDTALVGASADGTYTEYRGAAFVFTRSGSTWTQQGPKLTGGGEVGSAWFGESVALSADGNTALIGGPTDDGQVGAAWVFTRSGSTWTQQGEKLTGGGEQGEGFFGKNVALSADGDTALIGAYNDNEHRGAAWVFTRSGSTWTQQGEKLTGSGNLGFFGWGVALSGDGNTALIGEWGIGGGIGAAWVFTRSGSTWAKQGGELTGGPGSGYSWFGYSTALSANGDTALVGAPHAGGYAGAGWVFTRSGSTWTQQGEPLTGSGEIGEGELGYSAALSSDGDTALLGGRVDDDFHGAAWAFQRSGSTWAQEGEKLTGSEESANREEFGWSVALSGDGNTALVGSPCDKACVGSASAFVNSTPPPRAPEYGRCVKVAKGTGKYASAGCTTLGKSDSYEWSRSVVRAGFTTKLASGSATLETAKDTKVTCAGETGTGDYTGDSTVGGVVLTLTGCVLSGEKCSSAGAGAGEVVSSSLEGELGVEKLGASESKDKIGLDLFPAGSAGPVMEFSCGATSVALRGSVIVPVAANKMSLSTPLKLKASKGRQKPEGFVGEAKDVLEASFGGAAYEQIGLTLTATQADEEDVEVNAAV